MFYVSGRHLLLVRNVRWCSDGAGTEIRVLGYRWGQQLISLASLPPQPLLIPAQVMPIIPPYLPLHG